MSSSVGVELVIDSLGGVSYILSKMLFDLAPVGNFPGHQ